MKRIREEEDVRPEPVSINYDDLKQVLSAEESEEEKPKKTRKKGTARKKSTKMESDDSEGEISMFSPNCIFSLYIPETPKKRTRRKAGNLFVIKKIFDLI